MSQIEQPDAERWQRELQARIADRVSVTIPFVMVDVAAMLKQYARRYIRLGQVRANLQINYYFAKAEGGELSQEERSEVAHEIGVLLGLCDDLDLPITAKLLLARTKDVPATVGEFDLLMEVLDSELAEKTFFFVPADRAAYYARGDILSEGAKAAFPSAFGELQNAGNAYAVDLPTSCVFHCMRALEHGLRALATDLDRQFDVQVWQDIINQIESEIAALGKQLPKGQAKSERLQFLSEAAKEFVFFKDGWRNYVSHGKATYSQQQALTALSHARDFLERLSTHLRE